MVIRFDEKAKSDSTGGTNAFKASGPQESFEVLLGDGPEYSVVEKEGDNATNPTSNKTFGKGGLLTEKKRDFDDESDDDNSITDEELTWRCDPKLSLSDWTVEITVKGSSASRMFHVHKSVLAVGPKRSNYFATTFSNAQLKQHHLGRQKVNDIGGIEPCDFFQESMSVSPSLIDYVDHDKNKSRIELEQLAADTFPVLLDFQYSSKNQLEITTENATALHSLSGHLEMKSLRRKVREFWTQDLSTESLVTYYAHSRIFKDSKILAYAEEYCAKHIFQIEESGVVEILSAVDPQFFLRVASKCGEILSTKIASNENSEEEEDECYLRLSLLIAVYSNLHRNELTPQMFSQLTAETHLPTLEVKAAKVLLELENDICRAPGTMTSLKKRGIAVISKNWEESCFEVSDQMGGEETVDLNLPHLEGEALFQFVGEVLKEAKANSSSLSHELLLLQQWKEECESSANVEDFIQKELMETKLSVGDVTAEKDKEISHLTQQLEQQYLDYEEEKSEATEAHNEQVKKLHEECAQEIQRLEEDQARDTMEIRNQASSFRTSTLKLSVELSEARRQLAIAKDKLKLQRVADEGAANVLKKSDSYDVSVAEEKKFEADV